MMLRRTYNRARAGEKTARSRSLVPSVKLFPNCILLLIRQKQECASYIVDRQRERVDLDLQHKMNLPKIRPCSQRFDNSKPTVPTWFYGHGNWTMLE